MAEKSADSTPSPSSPTCPLSLLIGDQTPGSPARSLKPRYLKTCTSKSIDLGIDLHPLTRLKKLSSFGSDSLGEISTQASQGEEKKLAQLYEAKLKRLQQKVTDLTRLYRESERDAQQKLQFWQSKFLSTFQALKSSQNSELSAEAVQQLNGRIGSLEQQINASLGQGGEEELQMHRFNKEMLSKLKSSHQEKKQLVDQLTHFNDKFSTISSTMDAYTHKLDSLLIDGATESVTRELENARSTIERLVRERAGLEEGVSQLQTGNGELRGELVAASSRENQLMSERDRIKEELSELNRELLGREDELGERERDNLSLIERLEALNGEIGELRREVEARGRHCEENKQRHLVESDETSNAQQVELAESRNQLIQLHDQLSAAREKIHKQEEDLISLRGNDKSGASADQAMEVASLQERLMTAQIELEEQRTQSEESLRKKRIELDLCHKKYLEGNRELTELLEAHSSLQQLHRDKSRNCEQLERQVTDLSKALQACLEMQEQLMESFHIKQLDIDKLTGQASTLQRELSKSTDNHFVTKTQLQALYQRLQVETDQARSFEKKLRDSTREKSQLQQEISQLQQSHERSRSMTSPPDSDPEGAPTRHSYPYLSEEPLSPTDGGHRQMANSLPAVLAESKGSPNFSQNYRRALQKGLSQVELNESTSKVRENPDSSPDCKLYWVRRVSEMSLQMKESSEYWSAQVKELTLQLEEAKHSDTDQ